MALKITFLFLDLAKIHIFIPKCTEEAEEEGGWSGTYIPLVSLCSKITTSKSTLNLEANC